MKRKLKFPHQTRETQRQRGRPAGQAVAEARSPTEKRRGLPSQTEESHGARVWPPLLTRGSYRGGRSLPPHWSFFQGMTKSLASDWGFRQRQVGHPREWSFSLSGASGLPHETGSSAGKPQETGSCGRSGPHPSHCWTALAGGEWASPVRLAPLKAESRPPPSDKVSDRRQTDWASPPHPCRLEGSHGEKGAAPIKPGIP